MMKKKFCISLLMLVTAFSTISGQKAKHSFAVKDGHFLYDGLPMQIHCGEMHFARVPHEYWRQRLQMIKAMGMNAVATYIFWNWQETAPGAWDFSGDHDLAAFVKTAGQEGLFVILRPGPYACAEWEFGGFPWWLQKTPGLEVRTYNRPFLDSCKTYFKKISGQVRDLQITHGGPIIMVQVENELGSYVVQRSDIPLEQHKRYNEAVKQMLLDDGIDVPLYTADGIGTQYLAGSTLDGVLPCSNGQYDVDTLRKYVNLFHGGTGPYMVSEFYPGWLDHWGGKFVTVPVGGIVEQTEKFLKNDISFNYYMIFGGTNFGFTSGANYTAQQPIMPDITSYDYDAPISEAGWTTPKYDSIRALMQKYVSYKIPAVPKAAPVIALPDIRLGRTFDLFSNIIGQMPTVGNDTPMTFEDLGQGYGYVLYRKHFDHQISGTLYLKGLRDYALLYVNGKKAGELNRQTGKFSMQITIPFGGTLDILVENMGRINFDAEIIHNLKGIISPVMIDGNEITGDWKMYQLPFGEMPVLPGWTESYTLGNPVIYSGEFNLSETGDTFLDMQAWGKGIVFINGHNLGRYWKKGPQQTLYVPGCWLKKGKNAIEIFEQQNDTRHSSISAVKKPVLDQLNVE